MCLPVAEFLEQLLCHLIVSGTAEKIIIALSLLAKWVKEWNVLNA